MSKLVIAIKKCFEKLGVHCFESQATDLKKLFSVSLANCSSIIFCNFICSFSDIIYLSYQLLLVLISWLYVSHSPNPALKGEWDFSKIVVIGRGGGGGEWKIFARNGGKPGKGWVVGFVMRGWEIFTAIYWLKNCCYTFFLSFTDWRIAAILSL